MLWYYHEILPAIIRIAKQPERLIFLRLIFGVRSRNYFQVVYVFRFSGPNLGQECLSFRACPLIKEKKSNSIFQIHAFDHAL